MQGGRWKAILQDLNFPSEKSSPGDEFAKYTVLTIEGVDNNNNPIEATGRVDYLPQ